MKTEEKEAEDGGEESRKGLLKEARTLEKGLSDLEKRFRNPPGGQDIPAQDNVQSKISYAMRSISSSWDAPTQAQRNHLAQAEKALEEALAEFNHFYAKEVVVFRNKVREAGITLFPEEGPVEVKKEE